MPEVPPKSPEEIFWEMILNEPENPTPRLYFADWCDENDKPAMAEVQRWLAATGRRAHRALPRPVSDESPELDPQWRELLAVTQSALAGEPDNGFVWYSEAQTESIDKKKTLPRKIFDNLPGHPSRNTNGTPLMVFGTLRDSEDAVAVAWSKATQRTFVRSGWRPDYTDIRTERIVGQPLSPTRRGRRTIEANLVAAILFGVFFLCLILVLGNKAQEKKNEMATEPKGQIIRYQNRLMAEVEPAGADILDWSKTNIRKPGAGATDANLDFSMAARLTSLRQRKWAFQEQTTVHPASAAWFLKALRGGESHQVSAPNRLEAWSKLFREIDRQELPRDP